MSKAEKFISDCTRKCSNECCGEGINVGHGVTLSKRCFTPWITPGQAMRAVEIEKEEVIEKVCSFIDDNMGEYVNARGFFIDIECDKFIEDLKQAMKDE